MNSFKCPSHTSYLPGTVLNAVGYIVNYTVPAFIGKTMEIVD